MKSERLVDIEGYVHPRFSAVRSALAKQLREGGGGASVCVYHRGEVVVDVWGGVSSPESRWDASTMAMSFSTTKGVMSTLVHLLVDEGVLRYDEPVATYWPEFAQHGKERVTVRQLLCHEAGLFSIRSRIEKADEMLDWSRMTELLASSRPAYEPGSRCGYHAITYGWLIGELIRRVTGSAIADVVRTRLVEPLGLDGAYIGAPTSEYHRLAMLIRPPQRRPATTFSRRATRAAVKVGKAFGAKYDPAFAIDALMPRGALDFFFSPRVHEGPIPAANGVFTARSLARMYAMLASGGVLDGERFISEKTLREAIRVQRRSVDVVVGFPMRWRLGYHLVGTTRGVLPYAFGHFGFGGSGAWADPERNLSVAMTLNRVAGTPFGDMRMLRLGAAVVQSCS